jgi:hypothetical protein
MSKNQKIVFWSCFLTFCICGTLSIYSQGAFEYTGTLGGAAILVACYLLVAVVIRLYVVKNPEKIDKWFE